MFKWYTVALLDGLIEYAINSRGEREFFLKLCAPLNMFSVAWQHKCLVSFSSPPTSFIFLYSLFSRDSPAFPPPSSHLLHPLPECVIVCLFQKQVGWLDSRATRLCCASCLCLSYRITITHSLAGGGLWPQKLSIKAPSINSHAKEFHGKGLFDVIRV